MNTEHIVENIANLALEKKGFDVRSLKVGELIGITDYFLIISGLNDIHVKTIASHITENMKKRGVRPCHVEGYSHGNWILIDYGDVIVHVFYTPVREYYDLEKLWSDAEIKEYESQPRKCPAAFNSPDQHSP